MRYFVTGATGFVGGEVARQLVAQGHQVVAIARDPTRAKHLEHMGVSVVKGDVTHKDSLRAPMRDADAVFHVAGWYKIGAKDKDQAAATNIDGTRNVLEVMHEVGIGRGVYTSTLAVNSDTRDMLVDETHRFSGTHISEYDRTKAAAHDIALDFVARGLPLVIVMPGLVYGPGDTSSVRQMFVQYLQRKLPVIPQRTAYSWGHIADIAQGHILAMERGRVGESYMICGPKHTLVEAMRMAQEITGVPAPRSVPPGMLGAASGVIGLVEKVVSVPGTYSSEGLRVVSGVTYLGDNTKARRELGFDPRPLKTGLAETLLHEMKLLGMRPPRA